MSYLIFVNSFISSWKSKLTLAFPIRWVSLPSLSNNFSTVDIYKGEQLVSAIDLEGSVIELVKELTDLFAVLGIDCEVVEID